MTEAQIAPILVSLAVLLTAAHLLGWLAVRLQQPRLVGEILAGVVLGPYVLGRASPDISRAILGDATAGGDPTPLVLGFVGWLGLLLLMFISGSEVRRILAREQRVPTAWILGLGTVVPFVFALSAAVLLPTRGLRGPEGGQAAFLLVLATAATVTSIPIISRIFHELRMLHTRFASLVLGVAMIEDVVLFGALAVATALARSGSESLGADVVWHAAVTSAYFGLGLLAAPRLLQVASDRRWNVMARRAQIGYAVVLMLAYTAVAAALGVSVVFGAFLAGFGLVGGWRGNQRARFSDALDAISKFAFSTFIPLYFVLVGARLDLGAGFSPAVFIAFLIASSAVRMTAVAAAGRISGFGSRDTTDIAVALNARGGPGIVLATVALEAGIISSSFFTALVLTAIVTSQFAGWWLARAIERRGELLGEPLDVGGTSAPSVGTERNVASTSGRDRR